MTESGVRVERRKPRAMRLLHDVEMGGHRMRVERAPSGLLHYFVDNTEVDVHGYLTMAACVGETARRRVGAA